MTRKIVSEETEANIRLYAICRHVWTLNPPEIEWLDTYVLRRTTPFQLARKLRSGSLLLGNKRFTLVTFNFMLADLYEIEKEYPHILLSFRAKETMAVVLAMPAKEIASNISELKD